MLELNWNKGVAKDPVKLADYIELTLAIEDDHCSDEFTYAHFVNAIQDEPYVGNPDNSLDRDDTDEDKEDFLAGDEMDETLEHFENAVSLIERRSDWLGDLYPFAVEDGDVKLVAGKDANNGMPYLFLVVCSHHQAIQISSYTLEVQFEQICKEAMRTLFNESAEVLLFSQFSQDRKELGQLAPEAIKNLAKKLNSNVKHEEEIPAAQNEFGIDIAAIDRLDDQLRYPFFAFAQCTVSADWERKRDEAQARKGLSSYIDLELQHSNLIFIPHFPRLEADKWDFPIYKTSNCIICDRYRICRMLQRLEKFESQVPSQTASAIVSKFWERVKAEKFSPY